jgi:hypothetical protein
MMGLRDWSIGNRVALGVAVTVMIAVGARLPAMGRAASDGDVAPGERILLPEQPAATGLSADSLAHLVAAAVSVDPFQPARSRPAVRFRARSSKTDLMTADGAATPAAPSAGRPEPAMALQGIAHLANGNALAVLSVRGGSAQLLRVGQSLDDYRLTRVDSSSVTLVGADSTIILHLRDGAGSGTP